MGQELKINTADKYLSPVVHVFVSKAAAHRLLKGKTITLKIKTVTFEVHTRAQTIAQHTNDAHRINVIARRLLQTEIDNSSPKPLELRLMG